MEATRGVELLEIGGERYVALPAGKSKPCGSRSSG